MPDPFQPSKAVTFDLARGRVHLDDTSPQALVPADALLALLLNAGREASEHFGQALGRAIGLRVATRLEGSAVGASVESVLDQLAAELAVGGLGALTLERWGVAVVMVLDGSPLGAIGDTIVEHVLGSAVGNATGRTVDACFLARDGARARFFLGGSAGTQRLRGWLGDGVSWGDAIVRLHAVHPTPVRGDS